MLPFVNRELGWDNPLWLANGHSFQVLLDRYTLTVTETATAVEVGQVRSRVPRFAVLADLIIQGCAGEFRVSDGQAFAPVHLRMPLGGRQLVRAADGQRLATSSG